MTVTYTFEVSRARFWGFAKLLLRWRGSVYQLMYRELASFLALYYTIAFAYRFAFNSVWQRRFESLAVYCREFLSVIPVSFILGFYLSYVVGRWWQVYLNIPWPDKLAIQVSAYVQGADERGRMIRRALIRYLNLISVLTFQCTSTIIKKRFPTLEHLVEAGIMTVDEKTALETTPTPHGVWWVPSSWFAQLAMIARKEGRIHDDLHLKSLIDGMIEYRNMAGTIWSYDWISVPLSYTQVVTVAVYSFFASCLIGRQYLYKSPIPNDQTNHDTDFYLPVFTIFQFLFYVGWLKVAEAVIISLSIAAMVGPLGADDDDFEINWVLDRNVQVGYMIVDQMYRYTPRLTKDALWDDVTVELPYTTASMPYRSQPYFGSTSVMNITDKQAEWDVPEQPAMPPIDEETAVGGLGSLGSPSESFRHKLIERRKAAKANHLAESPSDGGHAQDAQPIGSDGDLSESQTADLSSADGDVDQRSLGSTQFNAVQQRRGRLGGLPLGVSRQTLDVTIEPKLL